jgi:hypothetical protein
MSETARQYLSEEAVKKVKGMNVTFIEDKKKYSKTQFIKIYKGYDMLENFFTVRSYIQKRYKIDIHMLEILLKLMGMRVFTRAEFSNIPKEFTYNRFNSIQDSGFINLISDHTDVEKRVWTLNGKGKIIVTNFYKYLSGEKRIPVDGTRNPMAHGKKSIAFDKKKLDLIKKMNALDPKAHIKKLYE